MTKHVRIFQGDRARVEEDVNAFLLVSEDTDIEDIRVTTATGGPSEDQWVTTTVMIVFTDVRGIPQQR